MNAEECSDQFSNYKFLKKGSNPIHLVS
jgi:hypothetical protein